MVFSTRSRMTGSSGIDVESMVSSIMKAESVKYDKLLQKRQLMAWKQSAYLGARDKIKEFQTKFLDFMNPLTNMRSSSTYNSLKVSLKQDGKESTAATVIASGEARAGVTKIDIINVATNDTYKTSGMNESFVGKEVSDIVTNLTTDTALRLSVDGVSKIIHFTQQEIDDINSATQVNDKFMETLNKKLEIFGKENVLTGTNNEIRESNVVNATLNDDGKVVIKANNGHFLAVEQNSADFGINKSKITSLNVNASMITVFSDIPAGESTITINGKRITFNSEDTVQSFMDKVSKANAGVRLTFDKSSSNFKLESTTSGNAGKIVMDSSATSLFQTMGFTNQAPVDATYRINGGAVLRSGSNTIEYEGLKITLNETTEADKPLIITTERNTQNAVDAIKKFVVGYNELIETLRGEITTNRTKKSKYDYYGPLTSDEKKNMTESEINTWEAEAKKGLLNRDSILNGFLQEMRTMLYKPVDLGNGRKMALYDIGITTSRYTKDGGKLIVDETKLNKAIEENIDDIITMFTKGSEYETFDKSNYQNRLDTEGLAERLADILNATIGANGSITVKAGTSASDLSSTMFMELGGMDKDISEMRKALEKKEDNYYAKFAAMENAINKSNQQMSMLDGFLYGGK